MKAFNPDAAPVKAAPELDEVDDPLPLEAVVDAGATVKSVVVAVTVYVLLLLVYVEVYALVVYAELEAEVVEDEVEFELTFRIPPTAPPGGEVEVVAFFARAAKAENVFPEVGALTAPTMPVTC